MRLTTALLSAAAAVFVSDGISQITPAKAGDSASSSASSRAASEQMEVMRPRKKADESAIQIESNPVKLKSITIVPGSGKAITAPSKDRKTKKDRDDR